MSLMEMSLSGAVLILVILTVRAVLKDRLPKRTFAVLWMVALLRLLIPFSVPSAWSAYTVLPNVVTSLENAIPQNRPAAGNTGAGVGQTADSGENSQTAAFSADISEEMSSEAMLSVAEQPIAGPSIWKMIWATGFLFSLIFFTWIYGRCYREFRMSLPVEAGILGNWMETHPLWRKLSIRQSDQIASPISYGVWHPVILLSKSEKWGDRFRLRYVLEHEYVHIQYFDAAVKLLMVAALCLHWYNPAVYLMYVFFNRDLELSCDETVVRRLGEEEKAAYAMALIEMEEEKSGLLPLGNSFSKNAIEERIGAIMKIKKITPLAKGMSVVLVCGVTLVFATSCGTYGETENVREAALQAEAADVQETNEKKDVNTKSFSAVLEETKNSSAAISQATSGAAEKQDGSLNLQAEDRSATDDSMAEYDRKEIEERIEGQIEEKIAEKIAEETAEQAKEAAQRAVVEAAEKARATVETAEEARAAVEAAEETLAAAVGKVRADFTAGTVLLEDAESGTDHPYRSAAYMISISWEFKEYKKFGLSYDKKSDYLMYQGQTVGYFKDEIKPDVYTRFAEGSGKLGIIVNRDDAGEIAGFTVFPFDKSSQSDFIVEEVSSGGAAFAEGDPDAVKTSLPQEYAKLGVKISDEKNNLWTYKGKGVAVIYDKDHQIFTNDSFPEKNAVYLEVIRDKKDQVTGLKEVPKKEMQKLLQEEQHTPY